MTGSLGNYLIFMLGADSSVSVVVTPPVEVITLFKLAAPPTATLIEIPPPA